MYFCRYATIGLIVAMGGMIPTAFGSDDVINACMKKNGNLRVIDEGEACRRNEQPLFWNVQGPQGEQGPKGDTGDQGPEGPPGQGSASVVDANGEVLGALIGVRLTTNFHTQQSDAVIYNYLTVFSDNGYFTELRGDDGRITTSIGSQVYYTARSCKGQTFVHGSTLRGTVGHVGKCSNCYENPLYAAPYEAQNGLGVVVQSYWNGTSGCFDYTTELDETFYEIFPNDPTITGIPNPEQLMEGAPFNIVRD